MKFRTIVFVVILLLSLYSQVSTQTRRSSAAKTYLSQPFNSELEELPTQFLGHSLVALFANLAARDYRRGEFEPTVEYERRMQKQLEQNVIGSVKRDGLLAFSFAPDDDQFVTRYDPDLSVLDLKLTWRARTIDMGLSYSFEITNSRTYIAHNVFNRAVRVIAFTRREYLLAVDEEILRDFPGGLKAPPYSPYHQIVTSIPLNPSRARIAKLTIRALVVGRLSKAPIRTVRRPTLPTVDMPLDVDLTYFVTEIQPEAIWFYDFVSGQVYSKITPQP